MTALDVLRLLGVNVFMPVYFRNNYELFCGSRYRHGQAVGCRGEHNERLRYGYGFGSSHGHYDGSGYGSGLNTVYFVKNGRV